MCAETARRRVEVGAEVGVEPRPQREHPPVARRRRARRRPRARGPGRRRGSSRGGPRPTSRARPKRSAAAATATTSGPTAPLLPNAPADVGDDDADRLRIAPERVARAARAGGAGPAREQWTVSRSVVGVVARRCAPRGSIGAATRRGIEKEQETTRSARGERAVDVAARLRPACVNVLLVRPRAGSSDAPASGS